MEVHPPEHPIHSVRDFFVHLFTITVGLLIALSLEGLVETMHHRHLLHTAKDNLRAEIQANRSILEDDEADLTGAKDELNANIRILTALRDHQPMPETPKFRWNWNGLQLAAWDTARNTGAIALMPYEDAQAYSLIYRQQGLVDDQALIYIRDVYRSGGIVQGGRKLSDLKPDELNAMIASSQQTIVDLDLLRDLSAGLERLYKHSDGKL